MDSVLRALSVYAVLLAVTRISGRRTLGQTTAFDFVLLLIIAETTDQALMGDEHSVTSAAIVIVTLALTDVLLSYLKQWSKHLGTALDGTATVLMAKGEVDHRALTRARVDVSDILEAARSGQGLARLDQIDFAVLEIGGGISIIPKQAEKRLPDEAARPPRPDEKTPP